MLGRKNLIILAAVLVVLVAVSLAQRLGHERATTGTSSTALIEGTYARDSLGKVVIGRGDRPQAVVLTAGEGDAWVAASAWNAPVNPQRIDGLLQALSGLRGEFRSDSESVLDDYGFTDSTTVHVAGYDKAGAEVFAVELGEKPKQGTGTFVREPGSSRVYLATADLLGTMGVYSAAAGPQSRHFLDLQAFKCEREAVDAITLEDGGRGFTLTKVFQTIQPAAGDTVHTAPYTDRASWEWRLEPRRPLAKTKVDAILATLTNLRAQDVADPSAPAAAYGLGAPARRVIITMADGSQTTISFGAARAAATGQPAGIYGRVEGRPLVWVLGDYQVENIFKSPDDLKPDA